jgi:hypothetical protein
VTSHQLPLFDAATVTRPTWAKYPARAARRNCDDCRDRLHQLGVARAPFPRPARWIRTADGVDRYLCRACAADDRGAS